jgi:PAS domain S-box-containing protein
VSFRLKTVIGIAIIEAALLTLLVFSGLHWLRESNGAQLAQRAETTARALATSLSQRVRAGAGRDISQLLGIAMADPELRYVRVLDADGRVLAARGDSTALTMTFREDQSPEDVDDGIYDVVEPVVIGGRTVGSVEVGFSTQTLEGLLAEARSRGLSIAGLEMLLVAVFSLLLGTWLTRQLNRLRQGAERIAREGPGLQLTERGDTELARVAVAFNHMSRQLADSYTALRDALSESRQLMTRVTESEHQKRQLVETALDGIVSIDGRGNVLDYNPSAERLFGYARKEVIGRPLDECFVGTELGAGATALLFGGPGDDYMDRRRELTLPSRDGSQVLLEITNTRWATDRGEYRTAFMRDISERKRYQQALQETARRAREANAAKSRFLASMSHEIRTPLNAILNMNELLLESHLDEEQRGYASTASESARSLLSIVNGVLDFSKIEAGRIEPSPQLCDPEEVLKSVVDLLAARAYAKEIQLTAFCDPRVPLELEMDQGLVRQILLNLIGNAIKFTDSGAVRVRLVLESSDNEQAMLRIEVADTGIGIAAEHQPALFEEFVQADGSTSRRYGGSGLGLAISRRLARLMGGDIELRSMLGEGSTFVLRLPQPGRGPSEARRKLADPLRPWRLLLHLDNALVADDLASQLRAYGLDVEVAPYPIPIGAAQGQCCGEIRLEPATRGAGGDYESRPKRVLLYVIGTRCTPDDDPAGGTVATLRIPVLPSDLIARLADASKAEAPARTPQADQPSDISRMLAGCAATALPILLAEDSRANQLVATTMLRKAGFRVDVAENGLQAVAAVNRRNYSLVLMDLAMPEMDGLEATGCIRALPGKRGRIPIIAMTANVFAEDRQRCLDAGMDDYLSKPVDRQLLLKTMLRWLPAGAPAGGAPGAPREPQFPTAPSKPQAPPKDHPTMEDLQAPLSAMPATPAINEKTIEAMAAALSSDLMPVVVATFVTEAKERIDKITEAANAGDAARAGLEGHALKGSAMTFGATGLHEIALAIELAGKSGSIDSIRASLDQLHARGETVISALRARFCPPDTAETI